MKMKKSLIASLVAGALCSQAFAAEVSGTVKNKFEQAVPNAKIAVLGTDVKTTSDDQGRFTIDLPAGTYVIDIRSGSEGHFQQTVEIKESGNAPIALSIGRHDDGKIVVQANPLQRTRLDMATPAIVVAGDDLVLRRTATLGDILIEEPGISMSSFGPAVARPTIRGLSGNRVLITTNQLSVQDASVTSADHDVAIEPLQAEQIEVLKGPATLMYGGTAVGGVINIVDSRINPDASEELEGGVELRAGDSATGEQSAVFALNGGAGDWRFHFSGFDNSFDDVEIPGFGESDIQLAAEGEERDDDEESGVLDNSFSETTGFSIGSTWLTDWGYIGVGINDLDKLYGIPGGHGHGEEEGGGAEEEEEEEVSIDLQQTRYDFKAEIYDPFSGFSSLLLQYGLTDYEHVELEGDEIGTLFENDAFELRAHLTHEEWDGWNGVWGLQINERDFSAIGDEAFVPPSVTETQSFFILEEKDYGDVKWEIGARIENVDLSAEGFNETYSNTGLSFSTGWLFTVDEESQFALNVSRAVRNPEAEELFSFGPHLATRTFEFGDVNLDEEVSTNIDLSYRFNNDWVSTEINLYYNQFSDFIYLANLDENDPILTPEIIAEAEEEELLLLQYRQQDANFGGIEIKADFSLVNDESYSLTWGVVADFVEAEFDNGDYVPRIPPMRFGSNLHLDSGNWSADLMWMHYDDQDKVTPGELPTEGFDMIDLEIAYRIVQEDSDYLVFFRANNLADEEARDHASFLKDLAPRVGRNITAGVRYSF